MTGLHRPSGCTPGPGSAAALDAVIGFLACPACGGQLARAGRSLRCSRRHAYDIARHGYVSLMPAAARSRGDTAAMVAARARFLAAGHFAFLAEALACLAGDLISAPGRGGCVIDVGAGPGYFLAAVLGRLDDRAGLALDASRFACRRAASIHPRAAAVACDAWERLPVAAGAAVLVLNVFAPRNGAELRRVLDRDARLIVVTPEPDHLAELTGPLGLLSVDERKEERLARALGPHFGLEQRGAQRAVMSLRQEDLADVAAMGPSAWHSDPAQLAGRIARLADPLPVTAAVTVSVYRPLPD